MLAVCAALRREARRAGLGEPAAQGQPTAPQLRRRAGALLAVGPLVGLVFAPSFGALSVTIAFGAVVLAGVGLVADQSTTGNRLTLIATLVAAGVAVAAGARFGPTGVDALDVHPRLRADRRGHPEPPTASATLDGLAPGIGIAASAGLFALAAFAHQDGLATVLIGFAAACVAFLAFNVRPASLFVGRAGRLVVGWTLAVGALAVQPVAGPWRSILTPTIVLGFLLLDVAFVTLSRLRHRRRLLEHRADHLVHRLGRLGWSTGEVAALVVVGQVLLAAIAVFTGRAVVPEWLGVAARRRRVARRRLEAGRARSSATPHRG